VEERNEWGERSEWGKTRGCNEMIGIVTPLSFGNFGGITRPETKKKAPLRLYG
jgi:hypothetical protein